MKSIIPLLTIPILAASVLVGCNRNNSDNPSDAPATNSNMSDTNLSDMNTNMPASNSRQDMNSSMPATNSLPDMNTNMPAGTNQ